MAHRKSGMPTAIGKYGVEKTVGKDGSQLFPVLDTQARVPPDGDTVKAAFDTLMRGLAHGSGEQTYSGYRALYEFGHPVVPELERRILQADWTTVSRPQATRMQTALVTLLHDIDEGRSRSIIDRLLEADCHPSLRGVLNSIRRYDARNFRIHEVRGLRVLVAREIDEADDVPSHMDRWLANVPPEDLSGIVRLYVIKRPPKADYAGKYMPVLSTITVIWAEPLLGGKTMARLARFGVEHTLYHEIGHHVHQLHRPRHVDSEVVAEEWEERLLAELKRDHGSGR